MSSLVADALRELVADAKPAAEPAAGTATNCRRKSTKDLRIKRDSCKGSLVMCSTAICKRRRCKLWARLPSRRSLADSDSGSLLDGASDASAELKPSHANALQKISPNVNSESSCFSGLFTCSGLTALANKVVEYVVKAWNYHKWRRRSRRSGTGLEELANVKASGLGVQPNVQCSVSDTIDAIATAAVVGLQKRRSKSLRKLAYGPAKRMIENSAHALSRELLLTRQKEHRLRHLHWAAQAGHIEAAAAILHPQQHGAFLASRSARSRRRWRNFPVEVVPWILFVPAMMNCDKLRDMVGWLLFMHFVLGIILNLGLKLSGDLDDH